MTRVPLSRRHTLLVGTSTASTRMRLDPAWVALVGRACRMLGCDQPWSHRVGRLDKVPCRPLLRGAGGALGLSQRLAGYLHDLLRRLSPCADQLLGHLECRVDDLAARAVLTQVREDAIDGIEELPHGLERELLGLAPRLDDPFDDVAFFRAGHDAILSTECYKQHFSISRHADRNGPAEKGPLVPCVGWPVPTQEPGNRPSLGLRLPAHPAPRRPSVNVSPGVCGSGAASRGTPCNECPLGGEPPGSCAGGLRGSPGRSEQYRSGVGRARSVGC